MLIQSKAADGLIKASIFEHDNQGTSEWRANERYDFERSKKIFVQHKALKPQGWAK